MIKFKNILKENPDYLYTDKMSLAFNSPGNWCFGIDSKGTLYAAERTTHKNLKQIFKVNKFLYDGRLWNKEKIISFWNYPPLDIFKKMRKEFYKLYGVYIDDSWQIEVIKKVQIDDLAREPRGFVLSKLRLLAKKINSGEKLSVYDRYDLQGYTEYLNIKEVLIPISEYKGQYFDRKDLKRTTHEESPVTKYMKSLGVDKKELMQYYKEMDKIKNPSLYSGGNKYFELGLLRAHKDNRGHKFMKKMELRKLIREEINRLNEAKYIYNIRAGDDDGFDYDLNVKAIKKLVLKYMPTITKNELERFFAFEVEEIINDISILDFEENKISNINKSFESKVKKMSEYWLSINGDKAMRTIFNRD